MSSEPYIAEAPKPLLEPRLAAFTHWLSEDAVTDQLWLLIGLVGQACLSARFLVQWLASERHKRTVVPISFWYFSIGGGVVLLAYAIHRRDFVFGLGQASGLLVYARNLSFRRDDATITAMSPPS